MTHCSQEGRSGSILYGSLSSGAAPTLSDLNEAGDGRALGVGVQDSPELFLFSLFPWVGSNPPCSVLARVY